MNRRRIMKGDETWFVSECRLCPYHRTAHGKEYCQRKRRDLDDSGEFPEWCPAEKIMGAVQ